MPTVKARQQGFPNDARLARPKSLGLEDPREEGWQKYSGFAVLIGGRVRQGSEQGLRSRRHCPVLPVENFLFHVDLVLSGSPA